jgi:putative transposase
LDNLVVLKTPLVLAWQQQHPNVHFHLTPTYASWLNQMEIWLGMITPNCIRWGMLHSVPDWARKSPTYVRPYTRNAQSFRCTYTNSKQRIPVSLSSVTQH